ncbi:hypothetical protein BD779DRAFT_977635 [Infundibulicybe gibba]|nr:hypothetical protein BD779DRAFT_977635 [Infundibulicybe gibba]
MKSKEYMKQVKAIREAHNHALGDFEMALEVAAHRFASRYSSLGNDMDGRTYWVLSPGPMEIEHARKIITRGAAWDNASMKQSNCRQSDRVLAKDWAWCVAVWGTAPTHVDTTGDEESHWWIFSEPAEIRKLALWVSNNPGPTPRTIECAGVTVDGLRNLTNGLDRYANILDWRLQNSSRWL